MQEIIDSWLALTGRSLGHGLCRASVLSTQPGAAHLALGLEAAGQCYFNVHFWLRDQPAEQPRLTLLSTHVNGQSELAKSDYVPVLKLFREIFPAGTPLKTFVRQNESLAILEARGAAVDPQTLPLVQLFTAAGWRFSSLIDTESVTNAKRRYAIVFQI